MSAPPTRAVQRQRLLAARQAFAAGPAFEAAQAAILSHLRSLLEQLEPTLLGLYWPVRSEFSAGVLPWQPVWPAGTPLALPEALRGGAVTGAAPGHAAGHASGPATASASGPAPASASRSALAGAAPPAPPAPLGRMVYRRFTGPQATARDAFGLPTADGPPCEPDVLIVPCVGFTDAGFRLGYGGGFFDRYLVAHPGITTVGIAWSQSRLGPGEFLPEAYDRPLDLILTEAGAVSA